MPATACTFCPAKDLQRPPLARVGHAMQLVAVQESWRSPLSCRRRAPPPRPRVRRRHAGSRSGPAGSRKPLPKPRASTTAISRSRRSAVVLQAVVEDQHVARPDARRAARRRPRSAVGADPDRAAAAARRAGSARRRPRPRRRRWSPRAAPSALRRRSRARRCPATSPSPCRNSAIQITSGVLPLPPTVMLPTTMTGMPGCALLQDAQRVENAPNENHDAEQQAHRPQQPGDGAAAVPVASLLGGLRGEGDLRQAGEARGLHHAHHRLVRRGRRRR